MRIALCRRLLCASALAVLTFAVTTSAAAPPPPEESYAKVIDADIAHLEQLIELSKTKKVALGRFKATAMLIAAHCQDNMKGKDANRMAALRAAALKVAEAAAKKGNEAATHKAVAALRTVTPDANADKKPLKLSGMYKLDLMEVMDQFGGSNGGGMNMEKDIRTMKGKDGVKDVNAAELIGMRTIAISEFTFEILPEFGAKKKKEDWDRWTHEMKDYATEIVAESTKGAKADLGKLKTLMGKLDASCVSCHNVFRDP